MIVNVSSLLQGYRKIKAKLEQETGTVDNGDNWIENIEFYNANIAGLTEEKRQLVG